MPLLKVTASVRIAEEVLCGVGWKEEGRLTGCLSVQGGLSGCKLAFVEIKKKCRHTVASLYKNATLNFMSTKRSVQPDGPPCIMYAREWECVSERQHND